MAWWSRQHPTPNTITAAISDVSSSLTPTLNQVVAAASWSEMDWQTEVRQWDADGPLIGAYADSNAQLGAGAPVATVIETAGVHRIVHPDSDDPAEAALARFGAFTLAQFRNPTETRYALVEAWMRALTVVGEARGGLIPGFGHVVGQTPGFLVNGEVVAWIDARGVAHRCEDTWRSWTPNLAEGKHWEAYSACRRARGEIRGLIAAVNAQTQVLAQRAVRDTLVRVKAGQSDQNAIKGMALDYAVAARRQQMRQEYVPKIVDGRELAPHLFVADDADVLHLTRDISDAFQAEDMRIKGFARAVQMPIKLILDGPGAAKFANEGSLEWAYLSRDIQKLCNRVYDDLTVRFLQPALTNAIRSGLPGAELLAQWAGDIGRITWRADPTKLAEPEDRKKLALDAWKAGVIDGPTAAAEIGMSPMGLPDTVSRYEHWLNARSSSRPSGGSIGSVPSTGPTATVDQEAGPVVAAVKIGTTEAPVLARADQGQRLIIAADVALNLVADAAAMMDGGYFDLTLIDVAGGGEWLFAGMVGNRLTRDDMPQIPDEHADEFARWVDGGLTEILVDPTRLVPTQREMNGVKVGGMVTAMVAGDTIGGFPPLVSADGRLIDGHHRWAAFVLLALTGELGDNPQMLVRQSALDAQPLMDAARKFGRTHRIGSKGVKAAAVRLAAVDTARPSHVVERLAGIDQAMMVEISGWIDAHSEELLAAAVVLAIRDLPRDNPVRREIRAKAPLPPLEALIMLAPLVDLGQIFRRAADQLDISGLAGAINQAADQASQVVGRRIVPDVSNAVRVALGALIGWAGRVVGGVRAAAPDGATLAVAAAAAGLDTITTPDGVTSLAATGGRMTVGGSAWLGGSPGPATGPDALAALAGVGVVVDWEWQHGWYGTPKTPFIPHAELHLARRASTDPELWGYLWPQDHVGCTCAIVPVPAESVRV